MKKERYDTGKMPQITIPECSGDLAIQGWVEPEVLIKGSEFAVDEAEGGLKIESKSNLSLMIPVGSTVSVMRARGDLMIKNLTGSVELDDVAGDARLRAMDTITIGAVHGDLLAKRFKGSAKAGSIHGDAILRNVSGIEINTVYGDLSARYVNGDAHLGEVMGDVSVRNADGDVSAKKVYRDANLYDVGGTVRLLDVLGDIRLRGGLGEGKSSLEAAGDVIVRWPKDAPLNLMVSGGSIRNKLNLDELIEKSGTLTGRIGIGSANLSLTAKGRIILKEVRGADEKWAWDMGGEEEYGFSIELEGLGERISMQMNEHITRLTTELEQRFGPEYSQRLAEQVARKAELAAKKAERVAQKAMRRAERGMRRSERRGRPRWTSADSPQKKKATNEEQLKILKMVEQGIISTDEASTLLEALES